MPIITTLSIIESPLLHIICVIEISLTQKISMKITKSKAGRKLAKPENPANPVVCIIENAMNLMPDKKLKSLAVVIDYSYNNLWGVYREWRNMPILPLLRLCKFVGIHEVQAIELFQEQPEPRNKAPRYDGTESKETATDEQKITDPK